MPDAPAPTSTSPLQWPWALASAPEVSSESSAWRGALLRCWSKTSAVMVQPPLDHHYIVLHRGGAKHVTRRRDGPSVSTVVESDSLTLVPAGTAYVWKTEGPISFAHLYLSPRQIESVIAQQFDADGRDATLIERVGCDDRLLKPLFTSMIGVLSDAARADSLQLDALLEAFCLRLVRRHVHQPPVGPDCTFALAPHRLRRVLDFIDANLGRDIGLADLVVAAGSSQSHFCRAFRAATGCSPYRFLVQCRVDRARVLLLTRDDPLDQVSAACGFKDPHQFAVMFKRQAGVGPKRFRTMNAGRDAKVPPRRESGDDLRRA